MIPSSCLVCRQLAVVPGMRFASLDDQVSGLRIACVVGEDRKFHPAKAEFHEISRDRFNRPDYDRKILKLSRIMVP